MVWPTASIPNYGRGVWLECNGQSFSRTQFPQLYEALGKTTVPNYQGMFLRGYGSQSYSQNNGEFTSSNTNYSSGSVGQIQGDAMRRLWGEISGTQFRTTEAGDNYESNFIYSYAGMSTNRFNGKTYVDNSKVGATFFTMDLPYLEYTLEGDAESGYTLHSEVKYLEDYGPVPKTLQGEHSYDENTGQAFRWWGMDSDLGTPSANEIRPVNVAVKFMIKAK